MNNASRRPVTGPNSIRISVFGKSTCSFFFQTTLPQTCIHFRRAASSFFWSLSNVCLAVQAAVTSKAADSVPTSLFVEILNHYLYYFDNGLELITPAVLQVRGPASCWLQRTVHLFQLRNCRISPIMTCCVEHPLHLTHSDQAEQKPAQVWCRHSHEACLLVLFHAAPRRACSRLLAMRCRARRAVMTPTPSCFGT